MSCDPLEPRRLFTNTLTLPAGSSGDDSWYVRRDGPNFSVWSPAPADLDSPGTPTYGPYALSTYTDVSISGGAGNDTVTLDARGGALSPAFHFSAGPAGDTDTLRIIGTTDPDGYLYWSSAGPTPSISGAGVTAYSDAEFLSLTPNGGGSPGAGDVVEAVDNTAGQTLVFSGDIGPYCDVVIDSDLPVRFDVSQHNAYLLYLPVASALPGGNVVLHTSLPSSMSGSSFDLNDDSLVLDYSGSSPAASLRSDLLAGRNGGSWDGASGIKSTTAHDDPLHLHAVGYAEAKDLFNLSGSATATWQGETVSATSLLARGTWYGDVNLDGKIDDDDFETVRQDIATYAALDPSLRPAYATWEHGDFNYDGVIDKDDLALMDAAYTARLNADFDAVDAADYSKAIAYTAAGDPTTDVPALTTALDDLESLGGGTLVPSGTAYLGSAGLTLDGYHDIRIMAGPGGGGFLMAAPPSLPTSSYFYNNEAMLMIAHCSNVLVEGLDFDGGMGQANLTGYNGISVVDSDHVTLDANAIHAMASRVVGHNANSQPIYGCGAGIWTLGDEHDHYTANEIYDTDSFGIYNGNFWHHDDFALHHSEVGQDAVIAGNPIHDLAGDGIVGITVDSLVADNTVTDVAHTGIKLAAAGADAAHGHDYDEDSAGCVVSYNTVTGAGWQGFQSDATAGDSYETDCTLFHNKFTASGSNGMLLYHVQNWTINDNICTDNHDYGAQIINAHYLTFKYNDFSNRSSTSQQAGIWIEASLNLAGTTHFSSDHITIEDNDFFSNQSYGVHIATFFATTGGTLISDVDIVANDIEGNAAYWLYIEAYAQGTTPAQIATVNWSGNTLLGNGNSGDVYNAV